MLALRGAGQPYENSASENVLDQTLTRQSAGAVRKMNVQEQDRDPRPATRPPGTWLVCADTFAGSDWSSLLVISVVSFERVLVATSHAGAQP